MTDQGPSLGALSLNDWSVAAADFLRPDGSLDRLGARHHAIFRARGGTLMVSFETLEGIFSLSPLGRPLGWDCADTEGWSSLCFLSQGDTWFRDAAVYAHVDRCIDDGFFDGFDLVIFYGAGSGAHAATAYSVAAPGARVLAIQPQATLDPAVTDWDTRFPQMRRHDFHSRYGYGPRMLRAAEQAWLLFDPREREDAMHATLFAGPNVTPLPLRGMGAALQMDLNQMDLLRPLLRAVADGSLTPGLFARSLRARRNHLPYLHRLLRRLERDERDDLTHLLCKNVAPRLNAPRFAKRLQTLTAAQ